MFYRRNDEIVNNLQIREGRNFPIHVEGQYEGFINFLTEKGLMWKDEIHKYDIKSFKGKVTREKFNKLFKLASHYNPDARKDIKQDRILGLRIPRKNFTAFVEIINS